MLSVAFGLLLSFSAPTPSTITVQSLLREMGDRSILARLPKVGYKQLQASSYDRLETDPNDPKTWFANADYGQFIRTEMRDGRTEYVVMEHDGPGAITRIWTPLLGDKDKMLVRFYFDGSDSPTIEAPFNDLMRGKSLFKSPFAFVSWPVYGVVSGVGSDLYYPIPFGKSCKVTLSELPFYYSFDYRAYAKGTPVETFAPASVKAAVSIADNVSQVLAHSESTAGAAKHSANVRLKSGKDFVLRLTHGLSAIDGIELTFDHAPDLQELRSTVIDVSFDGEQTVWCPIGEFFGCGIHDRAVWDRYRSVSERGVLSCGWTMPYRHSAELRFHNLGANPVAFHLRVSAEAWTWDDRSLHFHATWRNQYPLATRPMSDWNYLIANGDGVYVGDTLTVFSPVGAWYGEGDERVYQDGEKFPSHLGTGTEDYYGYAWGMAEHFSSAYVAMPRKDLKGRDNWMGYTTTSRIRGLDAIPFKSSLRFDMEIWDWADCKVGYSATTFWYARPGATSNREPTPLEAAKLLPEWSVGIKDAIECEDMKVISKSDHIQISTQSAGLSEGSWSNNTQLFLQCTQPGDKLELSIPVQERGRYHVLLYATKSYDYGVIRFMVNGQQGKDVDLWSEKPVPTGAIDLGEFDLGQGNSVLRAVVIGTNPKSTGSHYFFGMDCVVLKK